MRNLVSTTIRTALNSRKTVGKQPALRNLLDQHFLIGKELYVTDELLPWACGACLIIVTLHFKENALYDLEKAQRHFKEQYASELLATIRGGFMQLPIPCLIKGPHPSTRDRYIIKVFDDTAAVVREYA